MSIIPNQPGSSLSKALTAVTVVTQAQLRTLLSTDEAFRNALEEVIRSLGGDPSRDIRALATDAGYFKRQWGPLRRIVADRQASLHAEQQQQLEVARREQGVQIIVAQLAESMRISGQDNVKNLTRWVASRNVPAQTSDRRYFDISVTEDFSRMEYAGSFQRVLLRHLWAWVPRDFNFEQYLEWVRSGRYRDSFVWLCGLFDKEIQDDQRGLDDARRRTTGQDHSWVEAEAVRAALAFDDEWKRRARAPKLLPADPDYGLLNAAVMEQVIRRFQGRLNHFVPGIHVEPLACELLRADATRSGAAGYHESHYLGDRAHAVVAAFNQLVKGDLPWANAVDEHVRRAVRDGSLEGYQIMLAFDRSLERWRSSGRV